MCTTSIPRRSSDQRGSSQSTCWRTVQRLHRTDLPHRSQPQAMPTRTPAETTRMHPALRPRAGKMQTLRIPAGHREQLEEPPLLHWPACRWCKRRTRPNHDRETQLGTPNTAAQCSVPGTAPSTMTSTAVMYYHSIPVNMSSLRQRQHPSPQPHENARHRRG